MTIEISPEDAALAQQLVDAGEYQSIPDLIHSALMVLYSETIDAHIGASLEQAARGEICSLQEAEADWDQQRVAWLAANGAR